VYTVTHADHHLHHTEAAVAFVHADFFDVAISGVDAAGKQGDESALVFQFNAQFDIEFAANVLGPGQRDAFFRVGANLGDVFAPIEVHHHALAGRQVPHNRIAGNRRAALGEAEHQAFGAANSQRTFGGAGQLLVAVAGE